MQWLACLLAATLTFVIWSPRQTGRFIAKIVIGYRAQLRDEGHHR